MGGTYDPSRAILRVPDQLPSERPLIDANRAVDPEDVPAILEFRKISTTNNVSSTNFTPQEQLLFALGMKYNRKEWGKIAELLPGRTYQDCIKHYYNHKYDGRFVEESLRLKAKRREDAALPDISRLPESDLRIQAVRSGRALVSTRTTSTRIAKAKEGRRNPERRATARDLPDVADLIPLDMHIEDLQSEGANAPMVRTYPRRNMPPTVLPMADLGLLLRYLQSPFAAPSHQILSWLLSASVLLLVKEWIDTLLADSSRLLTDLRRLLPPNRDFTFDVIEDIAYLAEHSPGKTSWDPNDPFKDILKTCASSTSKLAHANEFGFFGQWRPSCPRQLSHCVSAAVLLTAYLDLVQHPTGFWAILLASKLAGRIKPSLRAAWESNYLVQEEDTEKVADAQGLAEPQEGVEIVTTIEQQISQPMDSSSNIKAAERRDSLFARASEEVRFLERNQQTRTADSTLPQSRQRNREGLGHNTAGRQSLFDDLHPSLSAAMSGIEYLKAGREVTRYEIEMLEEEDMAENEAQLDRLRVHLHNQEIELAALRADIDGLQQSLEDEDWDLMDEALSREIMILRGENERLKREVSGTETRV